MERLTMNSLLTPLLFLWLGAAAHVAWGQGNSYLQDACSVTQYRDLCVHSVASFWRTAGRSPSRWARAGVSVTISEAKGIAQYMRGMKKSGSVRGKQSMALLDCIECLQEALTICINRSEYSWEFDTQMNDVIMWMSSAITDENT